MGGAPPRQALKEVIFGRGGYGGMSESPQSSSQQAVTSVGGFGAMYLSPPQLTKKHYPKRVGIPKRFI